MRALSDCVTQTPEAASGAPERYQTNGPVLCPSLGRMPFNVRWAVSFIDVSPLLGCDRVLLGILSPLVRIERVAWAVHADSILDQPSPGKKKSVLSEISVEDLEAFMTPLRCGRLDRETVTKHPYQIWNSLLYSLGGSGIWPTRMYVCLYYYSSCLFFGYNRSEPHEIPDLLLATRVLQSAAAEGGELGHLVVVIFSQWVRECVPAADPATRASIDFAELRSVSLLARMSSERVLAGKSKALESEVVSSGGSLTGLDLQRRWIPGDSGGGHPDDVQSLIRNITGSCHDASDALIRVCDEVSRMDV